VKKIKAKVYNLDGSVAKEVELPRLFSTSYRPDVIKRAVLALQSQRRQPYGTNVLAGKRTSAHYHGLRRYRFTMMNREMSRIPRIHGKGAGYMSMRARFAPHAVKGRRAHPPKVEKTWDQKINNKEFNLAIMSGLAASINPDIVKARGHTYTGSLPIIFVNDIENVKKLRDIEPLLEKLGLQKEIDRCKERKIRAGKGKRRGRKYRKKKGLLFITSRPCPFNKAVSNIAGADSVDISALTPELLSPGSQSGRIIVLTESTLQELEKRFEKDDGK